MVVHLRPRFVTENVHLRLSKMHEAYQMWMLRSSEAEANIESTAGFQCTALTVPEWPSSSASNSPLPRCQTYTCRQHVSDTVTSQTARLHEFSTPLLLRALHSSEPLRMKDSLQPPKHDLTIQWPVLSGCRFRTYLRAR